MAATNTPCEKFQCLLRELFQFNCADLDFGVYRIMNEKREVIDKFIREELPGSVTEELKRGELADQAYIAKRLVEVTEGARHVLGPDALDDDGNLAPKYHDSDVGRRYMALKDAGGRSYEGLEADLFNHLHDFFNRYYQDGDFISKRRYSRRERYAVPYNGEEVYLHWANSDQYYVKTAEHFNDYAFTSKGVAVHFKLIAADVEQNNVKGDKRFFLPRKKGVVWDEARSCLVIPFEYRPLTQQEDIAYGNTKQQDAIIQKALTEISEKKGLDIRAAAALKEERRRNGADEPVSALEHHLRRYVQRNTSDFFIHKDLKGFLSRELDFYLKNEVLNLNAMQTAGEDRAEGWFQLLRTIKLVGDRIIEFLDQIERFQKMLWEKRKFVTETQYCITVGNIDESFYPEIAECKAQWQEWQELFHIHDGSDDLFSGDLKTKKNRVAFIKAHPTLVLDTRHLDSAFTDRLLGDIDELDEKTDGLLIHSENWQALNTISEMYRGQAKCAHIDPPYNTSTSGFLYKNDYQHSSWLAMMENRILAGLSLLESDGSFLCHIDENEYERLHYLFDRIGIPNAGTVVWDKKNPMLGKKGVATQHEYVIWRSATQDSIHLRNSNILMMLSKAKDLVERHGEITEETRKRFSDWIGRNPTLSGGEKAYRYMDDDGRIYQSVSLSAPEHRTDQKFFKALIHPTTGKPCPVPPNGFSRTPDTLQSMIERGEILFGVNETTQPRRKLYLTEKTKRQVSSVIQDAKRGKTDLDALGLTNFQYCHPVSFYTELMGAAASEPHDIVLDYFAGSGTTGHAVINLNRDDAGRRKFILVEMGEYFDTVLLPRIKKVTFAPEWKDGKPKRAATQEEVERSPRIVKYLRLESYEDALNNISFEQPATQRVMEFEDYLIKYMLEWETKRSDTLLNIEKLASPFDYKLHAHANGRSGEKAADVPETFNYLLGLRVRTRQVYDDDGRRYLVYRGEVRRRQVAVIWRNTKDWQKEDLERDKDFVVEQGLAEGADEIYVNGDSFIPGAKSLDPVFKKRMFAPVGGQ